MDRQMLKQVIKDQRFFFEKRDLIIERDQDLDWYFKGNEVVVISGIRRCGKSTLLKMIADKIEGPYLFVDFDDIRLTDISNDDLAMIESIAYELTGSDRPAYLLDEVQYVKDWERWVSGLYKKGNKVFVTGSNAALLGPEISTHLTGRNKVMVLHTFSFSEYLRFKGLSYEEEMTTIERDHIRSAFNEYMTKGGFPLVLKNDDILLTKQYLEDIIARDIVARYGIREVRELKDMVVYLLTNAGSTIPYSLIQRLTGLRSGSTVKRFIDHLTSVFLIHQLKRFDYSIKKQTPSKYYASDTGFLVTAVFNTSDNHGKKLENMVAIELIRRGMEVYYHKAGKECDFIIKGGLKVASAIQVTISIEDPRVLSRELEGLEEAMVTYGLKEGHILTLDTRKEIKTPSGIVRVQPVWEWMLGL